MKIHLAGPDVFRPDAPAWADGPPVDPEGLSIENLGRPVNLMLGVAREIGAGGLAQAIAELCAA